MTTYEINIQQDSSHEMSVSVRTESTSAGTTVTEVKVNSKPDGQFTAIRDLIGMDAFRIIDAMVEMLAVQTAGPAKSIDTPHAPLSKSVLEPGAQSITRSKNTSKASPTRAKNTNPRQRPQKTDSRPKDLGARYYKLGSISKVAQHYGVSNHIAQRWIRELQNNGTIPNPWPAKKKRSV